MGYSYDYAYSAGEELSTLVLMGVYLVYYLFAFGLGIAAYVLSSLGIYTIAKRRQINHPWLAWIPVANSWIIGSLSDQYRYVKKGQVKSKRKVLLILQCVMAVIAVVMAVVGVIKAVDLVVIAEYATEEVIFSEALSMLLSMSLIGLASFGVGIAVTVVHYMAMYDIYTSVSPANNVVFLVLSILFNITEPFFIFFNRKSDQGMPPRKEAEPQFLEEEPEREEEAVTE